MRTFQLLLVAGLVSAALCAASDPFIGKWRVNSSKSKLTDEMKVEAVGENKYAITFGPGAVDTIVADGTDQPALQGTTLAVTVEGPNHWKVLRKKEGRSLVMGMWTLSEDGKKLNDAFTAYAPDGKKSTVHYVYDRRAGNSGFLGTWDSVSAEMDSSIELQIQPYERDGLSLKSSGMRMALNIKFDGKDYQNSGQDGSGYAFSGRRVNQRNVELTNKYQGKINGIRQIEVSPDLKTLTLSILEPGESKAKNIFVFDRE